MAAVAHACGLDRVAALSSLRLGGRLVSSACGAACRSRLAVSLASALVPWRLWKWPRDPGGRGKWLCVAQEGGSHVDPDSAWESGLGGAAPWPQPSSCERRYRAEKMASRPAGPFPARDRGVAEDRARPGGRSASG